MFNNIFGKISYMLGMNNGTNRNNNYNMRKSRNRNAFLYKLVNFEQAKNLIEENKIILLDVRSKNEYDIMHIKNAINIPVNEIENRIFTYGQNQAIMVYCTSGSRSKTAIQILNNLGYNNIYIWEYASLATFPYKNMLEYSKEI